MDYNQLTFKDDYLHREDFVKNIMNVIEEWNSIEHENNSLVISIDAPWGTGKSYLINMWRNWLLSNESEYKNYASVYYNAWENDDSENAFIPLVYILTQIDICPENEKLFRDLKEKSLKFLKFCSIALLKDGIKKFIGEETAKIISEGVDSLKEGDTKSFFDKYENYQKEKEKFKESLLELIPQDGKLIIFIDELDRSRPTFTIETLEIIKHYFDLPNIVFVFSIDLLQLTHSIETIYGNGMDSAGYLRRFFDININIPSGNIKEYLMKTYEEKFKNIGISKNIINISTNIYLKLNLSLRDINKVSYNFFIFCIFYKDQIQKNIDPDKTLEIYLYFLTLKYKYPCIYNGIIKKGFVAYDNEPKNWDILELKYFISPNINNMLKDIQVGRGLAIDCGSDYINRYCFGMINNKGVSFVEHIEQTLELFSDVNIDKSIQLNK